MPCAWGYFRKEVKSLSFGATFFSFGKKQNSTARPGVGGTLYDINLKDSTDVMRPVIAVNYGGNNPTDLNYVRIDDFGRYYWITNWVFDSGLWYAHCKCDVLASYRYEIGNSVQYVKRAASDYDTDIIDVYPRKAGSHVIASTANTGLQTNLANMLFVVGVTSSSTVPATIGTTVYYGLSYTGIKGFIAHLVSMSYASFTDITDNLAKWICDPFQWIKSVVVFPFTFGNVTGTWGYTSDIRFGADDQGSAFSYQPSGGAYIINSASPMTVTYAITVPKHPGIDAAHNYLQAEPFSNYCACIAPFGKLQIPSAVLYDQSVLNCLIRVDPVTGGGSLYLGESNTHYGAIALADSQVGVSLPVDAAVVDLASAGYSALIGGGATAINTAVNGGNLEGILSSFVDGALSSMAKVQTISSGGKLCDLALPPMLYLEYYNTVGRDPVNYGYPFAQRAAINGFTGFVLCDNAEVAIESATYDEQREIESYMNSGFFYE